MSGKIPSSGKNISLETVTDGKGNCYRCVKRDRSCNGIRFVKIRMFHERICDLKKHMDVKKEIEAIKAETGQISILVNCAGVGYFGPHEQVNPDKIHEMVAVNIEAPMIIAGLLLRDMKKNGGIIINISSVTAKKSNTYGCAYGGS